MILINLLPIEKIKRRLRLRREAFFLAGSGLALALLLLIVTLALTIRLNNFEHQIEQLEAQRSSYLAIQRQISTMQKNQELLEGKIAVIEGLRLSAQLPVRVLDEVSQRTHTSQMWLTSLLLTNNRLTIAGVGLSNPAIARYMDALENSAYFNSADLASSAQTQIEQHKLKTFSLTVGVAPPPTAAANSEEEES